MNIKIIGLILILFIFCLIFIFYRNIKKSYMKKVLDLNFWKNKFEQNFLNLNFDISYCNRLEISLLAIVTITKNVFVVTIKKNNLLPE